LKPLLNDLQESADTGFRTKSPFFPFKCAQNFKSARFFLDLVLFSAMLCRLSLPFLLILGSAVNGFVLPRHGLSRFKRQAEIDANHSPGKENSRCNNSDLEKLMLEVSLKLYF
jgi:hypothetical protein